MKTFLGYSINEITKNETFNIFKDAFNFEQLIGRLYHSFINNEAYIITSKEISIQKDIPGIYYIGDKLDLYFTWDYLLKLNSFFVKKYSIKDNFIVTKGNYNIIFFLEFINKYK